MAHSYGQLSYSQATQVAELWNEAYQVMRQVTADRIKGYRDYIAREGWKADPARPDADFRRAFTTSEADARQNLRLAEDLRRALGQLDRGTHKPCTQSPGAFTLSGAYGAVRDALALTSPDTDGLEPVYLLAAALAGSHDLLNAERRVRSRLMRAARDKD